MFTPDQYQLLDFGQGRKLERFGAQVLDRPSPAADDSARRAPEQWAEATARFQLTKGAKGRWSGDLAAIGADGSDNKAHAGIDPWAVGHGRSQLLLGVNAAGNVGIFPEQAGNWDWIGDQVSQCHEAQTDRAPRVLNLFAYTGGATLAAAAAGAEVSHVDSSAPTVAWAKRNAAASEMAELPVRWLVDDALKFSARELKRGNSYDGIIADPPTYGHGPKGSAFKFHDDLQQLMQLCGRLLAGSAAPHRFMLFSCHAPDFDRDDAEESVSSVVPYVADSRLTSRPLVLEAADGRHLAAGVSARWSGTIS